MFYVYYGIQVCYSVAEIIWGLLGAFLTVICLGLGPLCDAYFLYILDASDILFVMGIVKTVQNCIMFCLTDYYNQRCFMIIYLIFQGIFLILSIVVVALFPPFWPCILIEGILDIYLVVCVIRFSKVYGWRTPQFIPLNQQNIQPTPVTN